MGGGTGLDSRSLLSSAERRGGGGEGGWEALSRGDFRGSRTGVCGRLGILKVLAADGDALGPVSGLTKLGRSPTAISVPLLGGDCGGWIMKDGGWTGLGLAGVGSADRTGERGPVTLTCTGAWGTVEMVSLSLGLCFGITGGSLG